MIRNMGQRINYQLKDRLGNTVACIPLKRCDLAAIIIEHKGIYYRPIHHNLVSHTAYCVPIEVVKVGEASEIVDGSTRQSDFETEGLSRQ
jgi:hypothetical protein